MNAKSWAKTACTVVVLYLLAIAPIFLLQRTLMFVPDTDPVGLPAQYGLSEMEEVTLTASDGISVAHWYGASKTDKPVIVLFHGNAGSRATRDHKAREFLDAGYGVFLADYRGYAGNPGKPTEEGLYNDARAVLDHLKDQKIILYGESLGTAVAVQMALEYEAEFLVLEAPFDAAYTVGQDRYPWIPVKYLIWDKFESIKKIARLTEPVLILHGTDDQVVPYALGKRLFEAASQPKNFLSFEGAGHNNLYDFGAGQKILAVLGDSRL